MRGGPRPGSGRPKGSKDVKTRAKAEAAVQAAKEGISPLDVLLRTMRHLWKEAEALDEKTGRVVLNPDKAKEAVVVASAAAPYCHAKIAQKEEIVPPPDVEEVDLQDAGRRMCFLLAAAEHKPQVKALPKPKAKQPA